MRFPVCREFRCWRNVTTLSCYMTPCQPLNAPTDDLCISISELPRKHIYWGWKMISPTTCARCRIYSQGLVAVIIQRFKSVLIHESFVSADEELLILAFCF